MEFQTRILAEAVKAGIDVVGTVAWAFDEASNWRIARERRDLVGAAGGRTCIAELSAPRETLLERNRLADRIAAKPNQAATLSDEVMDQLLARYRLNSAEGELAEFGPYLRIDSTRASAVQAARLIVSAFGLPQTGR